MRCNGNACVANSMLTVLVADQFLENLFIMTAFVVFSAP